MYWIFIQKSVTLFRSTVENVALILTHLFNTVSQLSIQTVACTSREIISQWRGILKTMVASCRTRFSSLPNRILSIFLITSFHMPNFDRGYDFDSSSFGGIVVVAIVVINIIYAILVFSGGIKSDPCDPYYSGDELVSDCSPSEARAEAEFEP